MSKFELYDRLGRPTLRFAGILIMVAIGLALAVGFWISVLTGEDMPNLTGGMGPVLVVVLPQLFDLITRYLQRKQEIAVAPRSV